MATILTGRLTPAGFEPIPTLACTLGEAAMYEPEGVYTVARTYEHDQVLLFDAHLQRLMESAQLEGIPVLWEERSLRGAVRDMLATSGYDNARFRVTIPREQPDHLYIAMEGLQPVPSAIREKGVSAVTIPVQRHNPMAKTTAWMSQRQDATADLSTDVYEAILRNAAGELLEGTTSNFYAILDGTLRTASTNDVLNGIARRVLLASAADALPIQETAVMLADIPRLREAFLTSASRGVIPIVAIDGQPIGDGTPGAHTRNLQARYDAWAAAHLEPL